jgi:hypothetical protein
MKAFKIVLVATAGVVLVLLSVVFLQPDRLGFWNKNWGNLASVAGLVLSFLATMFAANASKAAGEARDSVLSRTLEEEITAGHKSVSELTTLIEIKQLQLAAIKCSDLLDVPNRLRIRWEHALETSSKNKWIEAREQLDSIHTVLRKAGTGELGAEEVENVHRACVQVRTVFAEEQALVRRSKDRGHNG